MVPGGTEILSKLQKSPETLSDEELTRTSLSVFSKSLGVFASQRVIDAYLRWLEVQRTAPRRNINYHWLNTVAHWTQALRARGFSLEEIIREVSAWKEVNGPFVEPNPSDSESRLPPTPVNLAFGWDRMPITTKVVRHNENVCDSTLNTMSRRYDSQLEQKLNSALTKVPVSYVCNRCKGRGHYVGDCPTNEDPAYDIPAGFDYVCKFCKERGTHYFVFCPGNPDPNSIYRRRQERIFQSSLSRGDLGLRKTFDLSSESLEPQGPMTLSRSKIAVPKFSSSKADFDLFTKGKRISSREPTTGRLSGSYDFDDTSIGMRGVVIGDAQARTAVEDDNVEKGHTEVLGSSDGDLVWERLTKEIQLEYSRGPQKPMHALARQIVMERMATAPTAPTAATKSIHADFLSKLFAKHPSQPNPRWQPRMTALDMWDINDEKKRQDEEEDMSTMSERELSIEPNTPDCRTKKDLTHRSDHDQENSMDIDDEDYSRHSKQGREQGDFVIDTKGLQKQEREEEQEESPTRREKVRAIQKKINSIESLRTKLASGDDVKSPEMEQMASGDLSQEELDEISRRVQTPEPSSPSVLTSSSSELSSPPRISSSGSRCFVSH